MIGRGSIVDFYFTDDADRSSREVWASNLAERRALDYRLLARRRLQRAAPPLSPVDRRTRARDVDHTLTLFEGSLTA